MTLVTVSPHNSLCSIQRDFGHIQEEVWVMG